MRKLYEGGRTQGKRALLFYQLEEKVLKAELSLEDTISVVSKDGVKQYKVKDFLKEYSKYV